MICIIPARSGSKRIKNKNTKLFLGKKLIEFQSAVRSNIFSKILISTDNKELKKITKSYFVDTLIRDGYSDDHTTVQQACINTLKQIKIDSSLKYSTVIMLLPTNPLRDHLDIINAYDFYKKNNLNFLISANKYIHNPYWAFKDNQPLFPDWIKTRSQDLPSLLCPNGAIWIANINELLKENTFYVKDTHLFTIDWRHGIDIDNPEEFNLAKIIGKSLKDDNYKDIEKMLINYKFMNRKIEIDYKEIKLLEKKHIENTKHKLIDPSKWTIETDPDIVTLQKINAKKRTLKRNIEFQRKLKKALQEIKNEKYFEIINLLYYKNLTITETMEKVNLNKNYFKKEKERLLEILKLFLERD
jgi:CMP-N-acetylneuraminic acid synthetase